MGQLNLRGMDDELIRDIKATAASEGMTIPQFIGFALERDRKRGGWSASPQTRTAVVMDDAAKPKKSEVERSSGCPECGALNGLHQRGCKRGR